MLTFDLSKDTIDELYTERRQAAQLITAYVEGYRASDTFQSVNAQDLYTAILLWSTDAPIVQVLDVWTLGRLISAVITIETSLEERESEE
jgi:hypothetical protein